MALALTKTAAEVFATSDGVTERSPENDEVLVFMDELVNGVNRIIPGYSAITGSTTLDASVAKSGDVQTATSLSANTTTTLPSAATAGAGYEIPFKRIDSSAYTWTIACAGSDKIDGVTNWTSFPMNTHLDSVRLRSDGVSKWLVIDCKLASILVVITATNASYAITAGTRTVRFRNIIGAGAGSGGVDGQATSNFNGASGGGGSGAESFGDLDVRTLSTLALTIGAAGAAGASGANDGGDGGTTSVSWSGAAHVVTSGGGKGGKGVTAANGVTVRGGAGGDPATTGTPTTLMPNLIQKRGQPGGNGLSMRDNGGAGGTSSGAGGSSSLGGGGRAETAAGTVGTAAEGYGAGAGGSVATVNNNANVAGAAGTQGVIVMELFFLRAP